MRLQPPTHKRFNRKRSQLSHSFSLLQFTMNGIISIGCVAFLLLGVTNAFTIPTKHATNTQLRNPLLVAVSYELNSSSLYAKGFGKNVPSKKKESAKKEFFEDDDDDDDSTTPITSNNVTPEIPTPNAGVEALARLRRQQAEQKDEELRAVREMKSMEKYVAEDPNAAVIPEQVAQRMGQRMLPFVGIPLFGVMGTFVVFWYLATYRNMEFQPALVAFSTIGILGVSLLVS